MRILVVENSRRMQEALKAALDPFGTVVITGSADEAKQAFSDGPSFDLVFTDFHMRGGSGLEVVDYINRHHPDVPVVVITAYGTKELTIDCLNRQVFSFLEKPVQYEELKKVAMSAMSLRERTLAENRVKDLGILSNLIFHEIGGGLQDLLNETQSVDLNQFANDDHRDLSNRFLQLRNSIYQTSNTFRNLKFLILENRLNPEEFETFDLTQLLSNQSEWLSNWTESSKISVNYNVPQEPILLHGPPSLIERAIKNILINAVEALSKKEADGREIFIKLASKDQIILTIANSGPKIPQQLFEKLFEIEYSSRSPRLFPSGIGLYVVDRVMKSVGGQVTVESDDSWTKFSLAFLSGPGS